MYKPTISSTKHLRLFLNIFYWFIQFFLEGGGEYREVLWWVYHEIGFFSWNSNWNLVGKVLLNVSRVGIWLLWPFQPKKCDDDQMWNFYIGQIMSNRSDAVHSMWCSCVVRVWRGCLSSVLASWTRAARAKRADVYYIPCDPFTTKSGASFCQRLRGGGSPCRASHVCVI